MATENLLLKCERCSGDTDYLLPVHVQTIRIKTTRIKTTLNVCTQCQDSIADFILFPPRYTLVTLNPMTNAWVPRAEPMTLPDIHRTIGLLGNAAFRVYDFTLNLDQQREWWQNNPWALRNVRGIVGQL